MEVVSLELLSFMANWGSEKADEYFPTSTVERRELEPLPGFSSGPYTSGVRVPGDCFGATVGAGRMAVREKAVEPVPIPDWPVQCLKQ